MATINTSLTGNQIIGIQNIATFSSLPIGYYSISITFDIEPISQAEQIFYNWEIGATQVSASSVSFESSAVEYQSPITISANSTQNINFLIGVTDDTTPVYINSSFNDIEIIVFGNLTSAICIAVN